jgi:uncharacterized protein YciW
MLDFAVKLTNAPWEIEEEDRERLRCAGFNDRDIWDIASVAAFSLALLRVRRFPLPGVNT